MYPAQQIADWILSKINTQSGDTISPLKLQKLLYYCQAWHLTIFGTRIFDERIEAWAHGPVVPSQYARFAFMLRNEQIKINKLNLNVPKLENTSESLLNEVLNIYGEHSASYLEALTHNEAPWINARKNCQSWERSTEEITNEAMINFYSKLRNNGEQS